MKKQHIVIIVLLAAGLLINACKTSQSSEKSMKPMPASYIDATDSAGSAIMSWRKFFADSILVGLIDTALNNNLDVLMTLQKIEAARAEVKAGTGALFPEVSAGGAASITKFGKYTMDGAGNISTEITPGHDIPIHLPDYYIGLQTSWEIDIWGKLRNRRKAAVARYLGSIEARKLMVANLVAEVAAAYYELVSLDNQLAIIRENTSLQEDALSIVSVQKEAGAANELAVQQFHAQVLNSKALEFETRQDITIAENRINFLLGRFPQAVPRNDSLFKNELPVKVNAGVPSDLLQNRPDIRQAEQELAATRFDVKAAKAEFYPSLSITGALGFQAFNPSYLFLTPQSAACSAAGSLVAPLINRSAIKAQFITAKAGQVEALYGYQAAILNGYIEVYNELASIRNLNQVRDLKAQEVTVLNQSIETSTELFKAGKANYLEVLLAQRSALQSKLELLNTQQKQFNAGVNVYKALGGGWQ